MKLRRVLKIKRVQFPKILIAMTIGLLVSGCRPVSSFQPPYTDKDLVSKPSLVGTWDEDEDEDKDCSDPPLQGLKVEASDRGKFYELTVPSDDDSKKGWVTEYDLRLFQLNGYYFVDVVFGDLTVSDGEQVSTNDLALALTHFFARIWIDGDHVRLAAPNGGSLKEPIESKKLKYQLQQTDGDMIIFTGSTPEIQDFLSKYADDKHIFSDKGDYTCGLTRRPQR